MADPWRLLGFGCVVPSGDGQQMADAMAGVERRGGVATVNETMRSTRHLCGGGLGGADDRAVHAGGCLVRELDLGVDEPCRGESLEVFTA